MAHSKTLSEITVKPASWCKHREIVDNGQQPVVLGNIASKVMIGSVAVRPLRVTAEDRRGYDPVKYPAR